VEFAYPAPGLPEQPWPEVPPRDDFDSPALAWYWNSLRAPWDGFGSLSERPGYLRLHLRPQTLAEPTTPSFVGRRQQHIHFSAQVALEFAPQNARECAGLVLVQNHDYHFRLVVTRDPEPLVRLIKREKGQELILAEQPVTARCLYLKVEAHEQVYRFFAAEQPVDWQPVGREVDGRILSTPVAGGFVGTVIAMYASSNGLPSTNDADFDWFEYTGFDEE
jgi:xylan 1,4-beta-xylosidase